jgi:succinate dehydrogenase/fumarate reductase flavoprotein subunit
MSARGNGNRRQFLKTAAIGGIGAGAALVRPVPAGAQDSRTWDEEADVVVLGYGGAGAAAAIAAHDAGAKVLILEKQAADAHTSNTQMCLGVFLTPDDVEDAAAYMKVASRVNVDMPESQDVDDTIIRAWAEEMVLNNQWLSSLGAPGFVQFIAQGRDARWPGNSAIKAYQIAGADGRGEVGVGLFDFLHARVEERGIDIRWSMPAVSLVSEGGGVAGVLADRDGTEIAIRARRGVILATGGFNADERALKTFLPAYPMTFYGNPGNTGDGLRMAQAVGADLWHMTVLGGGFKAAFPDFPTAFTITFGADAHIVVDKSGRRFKAENHLGGYSAYWNALVYDTMANTWPRIPSWLVFDERRRLSGPLRRR